MNAVPFDLGHMYEGLANCHGLIRSEADHLCLEFQVQDSLVGLLKSDIRQVRIPLKDVASVSLRKTWFGLYTQLVVQVAHMETLIDVPGMKQGRLVLGIARSDRPAAEQFVAEVQNPKML